MFAAFRALADRFRDADACLPGRADCFPHAGLYGVDDAVPETARPDTAAAACAAARR
jgi:hypothetical protein